MVRLIMRLKHGFRSWASRQSFKDSKFSKKQLITYGVIFGIVGGSVLYFALAAPTTKTWDSKADFDTGTISNITTNADGTFGLTPSGGSTDPSVGANKEFPYDQVPVSTAWPPAGYSGFNALDGGSPYFHSVPTDNVAPNPPNLAGFSKGYAIAIEGTATAHSASDPFARWIMQPENGLISPKYDKYTPDPVLPPDPPTSGQKGDIQWLYKDQTYYYSMAYYVRSSDTIYDAILHEIGHAEYPLMDFALIPNNLGGVYHCGLNKDPADASKLRWYCDMFMGDSTGSSSNIAQGFQSTSWDLGPLVRDKWVRMIIGIHTSDDMTANSPGWVKIWFDQTTPDNQASINATSNAPKIEYHGMTWRKQSKSIFGFHPVGWAGPNNGSDYGVTSNTPLHPGDTPVNSLTPEPGRALNEHPPHSGRPIFASYPGFYRNTGGFGSVGPYIRYYFAGNYNRLSFEAAAAVFGNSTGSNPTYPASGSLTLPFDAGTGVHFSNFTPTLASALPAGTSVAYEARSSCDQTTWSAWGAVNSVPDGRYLQLRTNLATTVNTNTPTIDKLAVDYDAVPGVCPTAPLANLAPNSSFETDPLADYFNVTVAGAAYSWATDAANTGTHSLKIVSTASSMSRWLSQTTKIPATPGKVYVASGYIKTQAAASTTLSMNFWNSSSAIVGGTSDSSLINGTTNWTNATVSATAPTGAAYVRAEFRLNGAGTIWADDLSVSEAVPAVPSPVNTALPTISGTTTVGQTLTSNTGTWSNSPTSFGYQWQACDSSGNNCVSISGATNSTYLLTTTEAGKTIKVIVTAANATGNTPATSAATAAIATPPPPVVPTPTISQNIIAGQTLTGTITWTATVTANTSSIRQVVFAMDGNTNNTTVASPGPYERVLDTRTLTDGTHALGLSVILTDGTVVYAPYQIGNVLVDNADHTSPTTPANLTGTPVASPPTVNLSWTASTDNIAVTAYKIYRGIDGATPTLINTTSTPVTNYSDTSVVSSTNYTYQVTAVDAAGNQSAGSEAYVVSTPDITPPTTPTSLSIITTSIPTTLDLSWSASYDAVGVTNYEIYRGTGSATPTLLATLGNVTNYSDTTVSASTSYGYYLKAVDGAGNKSMQSSTFNITTPKLPDTTAPTVSITDPTANKVVVGTRVNITAKASDNEAVSSVQFYLNYDGNPNNNKLGPLLTTGSGGNYSYTWDTTTLANISYSLTAIATDSSNNSTTSSNINVTVNNPVPDPPTPPDTTAPSAPVGLLGSAASSTSVSLSWDASSDNSGGSGLSGYLIYRGSDPVPVAATDLLSYLDAGLSANTEYTYAVSAIDNLGNQSAKSSQVKITTLATVVTPEPTPTPAPTPVPVTPITVPTTAPTLPITAATLPAKHSKGDINGNDKIDIIDLSILLSHFNSQPTANTNGDVNGDGRVNVIDLSILLSNYGR